MCGALLARRCVAVDMNTRWAKLDPPASAGADAAAGDDEVHDAPPPDVAHRVFFACTSRDYFEQVLKLTYKQLMSETLVQRDIEGKHTKHAVAVQDDIPKNDFFLQKDFEQQGNLAFQRTKIRVVLHSLIARAKGPSKEMTGPLQPDWIQQMNKNEVDKYNLKFQKIK